MFYRIHVSCGSLRYWCIRSLLSQSPFFSTLCHFLSQCRQPNPLLSLRLSTTAIFSRAAVSIPLPLITNPFSRIILQTAGQNRIRKHTTTDVCKIFRKIIAETKHIIFFGNPASYCCVLRYLVCLRESGKYINFSYVRELLNLITIEHYY